MFPLENPFFLEQGRIVDPSYRVLRRSLNRADLCG